MTTHRRAWMGRAGVIVTLMVGAFVAVPASPAAAEPPEVQITGLSPSTLTSGERATLTFRVTNNNRGIGVLKDEANIRISTSFGELRCDGECQFTDQIDAGGSKQYTARLVAGDVPTGETKSGKVEVQAKIGPDESKAERDVTVRGPQPETVAEISGRVTNVSTGEPVSGAIVAISDSESHRYDVETGDSGRFKFTGSGDKPITPGTIQIGAMKDDVKVMKTIEVGAGKSLTGYRLVLRLTPPSSAAPTTAGPSVEPTLTDDAALDEPTAAAPQPAANEDSGGFGSLLMIIIGGLLVALGVGAIVLLWLRRKDADGEDEVGARPGGGPIRPAYAGADDPTRIGGAPGGPYDATMVNRSGLADAPTMMHNRPLVDDEFPDPYGAPLPPPQPPYAGQQGWAEDYGAAAPTQVGYGGPETRPSSGGGYGTGPVPGGGYGTAPASGGGYGGREAHAPAGPDHRGGYDERYDQPTGYYGGGEASPYGRGYEAGPQDEPAGRRYGPESGYERNPGPGEGGRRGAAGGYGDRGGYDQGGYDGDRGRYDERNGYDRGRGGYDGDRGGYGEPGYDRVPGQRDAGYDDRGYDRGDYHDEPAGGRRGGPPPGRGGRRPVDWLDD